MSSQQWTAADVPDQTGRVAVVTGANSGIGFETAKVLAERGASVVLAVRDVEKGKEAATRIAATAPGADVTIQEVDLSVLASVRDAAEELRSWHDKIDLLINNAGVGYTPQGRTADGFELQFGTNHLGHFAFTGLLLDRLLPVPGSRVVTISSAAHRMLAKIHFDDLQLDRGYGRMTAYGQSKLANLMFTYELQRRLEHTKNTIAVAAHPGGCNTGLGRNAPVLVRALTAILSPLIAQSATMGALPTLRAATDPGVLGGQYFGPDGLQEISGHPVVVDSSPQSHDADTQRRLWTVSQELTGVNPPV